MIEERLGASTLIVAVPDTEPMVAVIVTDPAFSAVSTPDPLTVATAGLELCQVACEVTVCVVLSEYVP